MLAFLAPFLQPILNFFGGPVIAGVVQAHKDSLAAGNTTERIAADLAGRELVVQQREEEVQSQLKIAEIGHFWEPDKLFEYTLWLYFSFALIWCNMLHYAEYQPLEGDLAKWAAMIMLFLFGKRGFENVARIIKR